VLLINAELHRLDEGTRQARDVELTDVRHHVESGLYSD